VRTRRDLRACVCMLVHLGALVCAWARACMRVVVLFFFSLFRVVKVSNPPGHALLIVWSPCVFTVRCRPIVCHSPIKCSPIVGRDMHDTDPKRREKCFASDWAKCVQKKDRFYNLIKKGSALEGDFDPEVWAMGLCVSQGCDVRRVALLVPLVSAACPTDAPCDHLPLFQGVRGEGRAPRPL